jgi:hypothetical protein
MSAIPGIRSSPGFCHIRRQGKRSAQKQIICPIYRAWPNIHLYRMGLEQNISARKGTRAALKRMK